MKKNDFEVFCKHRSKDINITNMGKSALASKIGGKNKDKLSSRTQCNLSSILPSKSVCTESKESIVKETLKQKTNQCRLNGQQ